MGSLSKKRGNFIYSLSKKISLGDKMYKFFYEIVLQLAIKKISWLLFLMGSVVSCTSLMLEQRKAYCLKAAKMAGYKKGEFSKELMFQCMTPAISPQAVKYNQILNNPHPY